MPALRTPGYISACLEPSAFCRLILPRVRFFGGLGFSGLFIRLGCGFVKCAFGRYFLGLFRRLGNFCYNLGCGFRLDGSRFRFLGWLTLALLLLCRLRRLASDQFRLLAGLFFPQRRLFRANGHWRGLDFHLGSDILDHFGHGVPFHQHALLFYLDLDRACLTGTVRLLDFGRLSPRQRYFVFSILRTVNPA